jgi:hypothetical protein
MQGERQFGLTNGAEVNENNHTYDDDDLMAMMETWPPDSVELSSLWQILIYLLILHFPLCCCQFCVERGIFFYCARKFLTANGCRCGARWSRIHIHRQPGNKRGWRLWRSCRTFGANSNAMKRWPALTIFPSHRLVNVSHCSDLECYNSTIRCCLVIYFQPYKS